jgi:hypothetical protein
VKLRLLIGLSILVSVPLITRIGLNGGAEPRRCGAGFNEPRLAGDLATVEDRGRYGLRHAVAGRVGSTCSRASGTPK